MIDKILIVIFVFFLFQVSSLAAQELIKIDKESIPLIKGASIEEMKTSFQQQGPIRATVKRYSVNISSNEIIDFYHSYFQNNGWAILGGAINSDKYNAMLKKKSTKFTLIVYPDEDNLEKTIIKFIW